MNKLSFLLLFSLSVLGTSVEAIETDLKLGLIQAEGYPVYGTLRPKLVSKLSAQVNGKVEQMLVDVGDLVEKGQIIALLDPLFFELEFKKQQTVVEMARSAYEDAEIEFMRMKNLWEKQAGEKPSIPKKQFDEAKFRLTQKKLQWMQAQIDLDLCAKRLEETAIKAPYAGVITKRFVDPGEAVTVTPVVALVELMDVSEIIFEFSLPQDLTKKVHPGLQVSTKLENNQIQVLGTIEKVFPQIEESTRSLKCRVVLENKQFNLKPGACVFAEVQLNQEE